MMLVSSSSESETRPISTLGVRVEAAPVASPAPPSPKRHVKPPPAAKRARIVLEVKSATPSPERCAPRRPPLSPVAEALAPALTPVPEAAAPPKQQRPPSSALAGARALDGAPTVARAPAHAGKSALAGAPSPTGAPGAAGAPAPAGAPAEAQAAPRPSSAVEVQAGVASGHAKSPIAEEENEGHKVDKDDNADEAAHYAFRAGELLAARYRLSELLGDGTFGRVVLAHDSKEDEAVALKIVRNVPRYADNAKIEASILQHVASVDQWGLSRCALLFDTFVHGDGFMCLVFERLGMSLHSLLRRNAYRGLWAQDIQSMALQLLKSLHFLHSKVRLTHTDLKLENVLLQEVAEVNFSLFPREAFWREMCGMTEGGGPGKEYLRPASSQIKIIDFGNAVYDYETRPKTINTRQYRGPEVVLGLGWDERSDLWSLGCILLELYSGELLFPAGSDIEHLALLEAILGPLPSSMLAKADESLRAALLAQGSDGRWQVSRRKLAAACDKGYMQYLTTRQGLARMVTDSHVLLADCAAMLLTLDPELRPSASQALRHTFFSTVYDD
eukprot:TRINITY_DN30791_c0_g1_i1.p1 TRINITY_DN30791_c0_g1~~TRINITY_DN30791_c0_g1_i1.p1  ORF type:complete len:559 (-),score=126.47 TRINITY_DN30791_c0_g1_i1:3-1679(-)